MCEKVLFVVPAKSDGALEHMAVAIFNHVAEAISLVEYRAVVVDEVTSQPWNVTAVQALGGLGIDLTTNVVVDQGQLPARVKTQILLSSWDIPGRELLAAHAHSLPPTFDQMWEIAGAVQAIRGRVDALISWLITETW